MNIKCIKYHAKIRIFQKAHKITSDLRIVFIIIHKKNTIKRSQCICVFVSVLMFDFFVNVKTTSKVGDIELEGRENLCQHIKIYNFRYV